MYNPPDYFPGDLKIPASLPAGRAPSEVGIRGGVRRGATTKGWALRATFGVLL